MGFFNEAVKNVFRYTVLPEDNEGLDIGRVGLRWNQIFAKSATVDTLNYVTLNPPPAGASFPQLAPDGSAPAPSYSFVNDTGMGMYRAGAGQLGFAVTGTQSLVVRTTGTTTASETLTNNTNQITLGTGTLGVITMAALGGARTYTLPDASGTLLVQGAGGNLTIIDKVGTVTTGTWQGTVIDTTRGGWGQSMAAASGLPTWNTGTLTLTAVTSGAYIKGAAGNAVSMQATPIPASDGGLGVNSPTAHGILVGEGASAVTPIVLTNGQLLIGSTGADPVAAGLTAGSGITITPAAGSITIATSGGSGVSIYDRVTADTTVVNTAAETTIYTKSITGGDLSTNKRLRLAIQGKITVNDGIFTATLTLRFKYGATTLATVVISGGDGAANFFTSASAFVVDALLSADGATNSQLGHIFWRAQPVFYSGTYNTSLPKAINQGGFGTAAEDSTAAKTLVITAQWSGADVSDSVTMQHAIMELL